MDNQQYLLPGKVYHIYNRTNGKEHLFFREENYLYFLKKYDFYLSGFLKTYAYCLMPNHFHLLVRIREDIPSKKVISEQFRKLFISYSKSINKEIGRHGSLFQKNFKRKCVDTEEYFIRVVFYIHSNPEHHRMVEDFRKYPHSSYSRFLIDKKSKLEKDEVFALFFGKEKFLEFHNEIKLPVKNTDIFYEGME